MKNKKLTNKKIKIIIAVVPIIISVILIYRFFSPFGAEVKYTYSLKDNPEIMSDLKPIEEINFLVKDGNNYLQVPKLVMKNDKVQFNVKLPTREESQVNVKMRFKNDNEELKVGVRSNPKSSYQYKILDNKVLDNLDWDKIMDSVGSPQGKINLSFWQKYKNYKNIQELINRPSYEQVIAQYLYDINDNFRIKDYQKSDKELVIDYSLRGSHTFYTYIKDEILDFTIEKQDINAYEGKDELEINIFKEGRKIYTQTIEDDGIIDRSINRREPQIAHIQISDLDEGVYKIELNYKGAGDDILITKISARQHLLVFKEKMFIVSIEPATIWTDSEDVDVKVVHEGYEQTLKINDSQDFSIDQAGRFFTVAMDKDLNKIYFPKNDIIITSDGYFSFFPESFFNPWPYNTVEFTNDINLETVDYIIADYGLPEEVNGWLENEVSFDISDMEIADDTLEFVLEAPGLKADNGEIIIDNLEIILTK